MSVNSSFTNRSCRWPLREWSWGQRAKLHQPRPRCPENINPCLCNSCTDESKDRRDSALFQPTKLPGQSWRSTTCYNSASQGAFGKIRKCETRSGGVENHCSCYSCTGWTCSSDKATATTTLRSLFVQHITALKTQARASPDPAHLCTQLCVSGRTELPL